MQPCQRQWELAAISLNQWEKEMRTAVQWKKGRARSTNEILKRLRINIFTLKATFLYNVRSGKVSDILNFLHEYGLTCVHMPIFNTSVILFNLNFH